MTQKLKAIYKDDRFIPQQNSHLPENTEVELMIAHHHHTIDPEVRKEISKVLIQRMQPCCSGNYTRYSLK